MKAIETRYKGYRFRSRLEARWAGEFIDYIWDQESLATPYLWHPFETMMALTCGLPNEEHLEHGLRCGCSFYKIPSAADAARSARFEHGESGARS